MRVLVGCEYSGTVRDAFLRRGHDAVSCDLLPTESPGPHYQGDVLDIINEPWDLVILHPDCTYLTCSAEWAYGDGPYHQKVKPETLVGAARRTAREEALRFVERLWKSPAKRKCLENPVGVINRYLPFMPRPQYVHPHQFGDDASKRTGLWLENLPRLRPTEDVEPRWVDGRPRWANQTDSGQNRVGPSENRWKLRAATYAGIANAMAQQWGDITSRRSTS
jgi:hypothetical protein